MLVQNIQTLMRKGLVFANKRLPFMDERLYLQRNG
jgi:hypothetical protein